MDYLKAKQLSKKHHANQLDKAGKTYLEHLFFVSSHCRGKAKIVALLHDILEDTACTIQDLEKEGFDSEIIAGVIAITKGEEPYEDYLQHVKENVLAREVKIQDLKHNMDLSRLPRVTSKDLTRQKKYQVALEYLSK